MKPLVKGQRPCSRFLGKLQRRAFQYFWLEANPENGLVFDKSAGNWPASIAAMGMALSVYPIAVQRRFITRGDAAMRVLNTLRFLWNAEQSSATDASGYKGFFYHFLDMSTGRRAWESELSSVDTALLMAGVLTCSLFFQKPSDQEVEIRKLAQALFDRVDWTWMQAHSPLVCHGWTPESGFLPWEWKGYDEALVLYLLGLGSTTHPLSTESYPEWARSYEWKKVYDIENLFAGPLFIHQLSHLWIDFRDIQDEFMRAHNSDYFENSRRAAFIQQRYAIDNPHGFLEYSEKCWGVTASDGPGDITMKVDGRDRRFFDYIARGAVEGPDDGTLAPWAVVASLPFAPEIVLPTIEHYNRIRVHEENPYGFKASFNPTFPTKPRRRNGWVSPFHFGINEGPTVIMIENYRSEMIWKLFRDSAILRRGLTRAGFTGGWLDEEGGSA